MLPTVTAFILCENILNRQGRISLLGLIKTFEAVEFPVMFRDIWLYCALTNGRGEVVLTLRLIDAEDIDAEPTVATRLKVNFHWSSQRMVDSGKAV